MPRFHQLIWLLLVGNAVMVSHAQQLSVPRIDAMPDRPSPYFMRDWKMVARGYDSLVYDFSLSEQYLPLIFWDNNPANYPTQKAFGLHTVVGTTAPGNSEAINVLPSIIGATLAGIDKSNQDGNNWVLMSQNFFNIKSGELVYLNNEVAHSGDDWWYDAMPNIFFYQIYWLYPGLGDSERQFVSVADRWLKALQSMGGSTTPWHAPNMDHRGWKLLTMTPNDIPQQYHEPEAAGALAWLFYSAWVKTGELKYRAAAELSMEFLNSFPSNPAYELQLSYGASIAARMNAELGTTYDLPKIVNWCFDVSPIRSWGAMVGKWGGYDCSGLIGEVNGSNDYAFLMNTFEQVGALVPLVRYDPRFARAIGKWVLNAANAARLFYPNFLPDQNQDSEEWSHIYDPDGYIGHEAMRQHQPGGVASPYATGDAISGKWGLTNLSLYSSSHVGILGGIIDTTNVPGILRLDLLKTDYFHDSAYATYLYYNPDSSAHSVQVDAGAGQHDLYDAVTGTFLKTNITGQTAIDLPGKGAVVLVITPSGGTTTYQGTKMLVNGVVVDYHTGGVPGENPPRIKGLGAMPDMIYPGHSSRLYCTAFDPDGDSLSYAWSAAVGTVVGAGSEVSWTAPVATGVYAIGCIVNDGRGGVDSALVRIAVVDSTGPPPVIWRIYAHPGKVDLNASSLLTCSAYDPSGYPLTYSWSAGQGSIAGSDSTATWTAPGNAGNYYARCTVSNGHGGQAMDSVQLEVRDFRFVQHGRLIAYYPFNGNADDASGFNNHGTVYGATSVPDRAGNPAQAYSFNGSSSWIKVPNNSTLNFDSSITVAFWMNVKSFYPDREQYPISHGNWQNRWKVSISHPETDNSTNLLRWTVKTVTRTLDLNSKTDLELNKNYHVAAVYNGSDAELYLNGELDAFASLSGLIAHTTYDLSIGRSLPAEVTWSFNGVLDEVRIYDYALSYADIQALYGGSTGVGEDGESMSPRAMALQQNYPNPFNPVTTIKYTVGGNGAWGVGDGEKAGTGSWGLGTRKTRLIVYDVLGRQVATLVDEAKAPGAYEVRFDGSRLSSGVYIYRLMSGSYVQSHEMVLLK